MDVKLEGPERIGKDSRGSQTPRHSTTAQSEAPPDHDEDANMIANQMNREAFPDDIPDQPVGHENDVADLFMPEEDDEDAMVTTLLLAGVESDVAKIYAARFAGSRKAETFLQGIWSRRHSPGSIGGCSNGRGRSYALEVLRKTRSSSVAWQSTPSP